MADGGVFLHWPVFVGGEWAGFFEDVVGDVEFADVVEDGGVADLARRRGERPSSRAREGGVVLETADVVAGVLCPWTRWRRRAC